MQCSVVPVKAGTVLCEAMLPWHLADRNCTEDENTLHETAKTYPRTAVSPSFQKLRNGGHTDVKEDKDKN